MMNTSTADEPVDQPMYDLITIGSGSAARAAANEARRLGRSVAMIERGLPGGTCLNVGCVPSKSLLAAAAAFHAAGHPSFAGVETSANLLDLGRLTQQKDAFLSLLRERDHVEAPFRAGIKVYRGQASFASGQSEHYVSVQVRSQDESVESISARHVLIASGAAPFVPAIPGLETVDYLTSSTSMSLEQVPESMLILGGNAIGLEQAQLFSRLGSRVTVVEIADRIAPLEDPAVSASLQIALAAEGVTFHTGTTLSRVKRMGGSIQGRLDSRKNQTEIVAERLLIATGRRPATDGLNLKAVDIEVGDRGHISVDEHLRTNNPRVWASGDVTGLPQFVYVASAQGTLMVNNAFGDRPETLDYRALPRVIFTSPQLASVGVTPGQAAAQGIAHEVREAPMGMVVRAIINHHTEGLIRLVSEPGGGKVLGVHMTGDSAGEVIAAATYALSAGLSVEDLKNTWSPFLTMSEALKVVAKQSPLA